MIAHNHIPDSPYKGLMPFSEEDAQFFFGREAEREIIIANLIASRLTLFYGSSGVGKSSVLRAGVSNSLQREAQKNLFLHGKPELAVVVFNSWRDNPLNDLVERMHECVKKILNAGAPNKPLSGKFIEILEWYSNLVEGELLIILDQFEEYFLYHPQDEGEGSFAYEFPRAVNHPNLRAHFLISIREDAYAKLDFFKGRIPTLFDNYLRIDHLGREAARDAIIKPVDKYNEITKKNFAIEPELVDEVLEQVRSGMVMLGGGKGVIKKNGSATSEEERIETPYLQLVMTRLWNKEMEDNSHIMKLKTLKSLGGAQKIVRTHLDDVMKTLSEFEREATSKAFYFLVTPGGAKIAHTLTDLSDYTKLPQSQLKSILDKLSESRVRILKPVPLPDQPGISRYEIFHDVLAKAILGWLQDGAETKAQVQQTRANRLSGLSIILIIGLLLLLWMGYKLYKSEGKVKIINQTLQESLVKIEAQNIKLLESQKQIESQNKKLQKSKDEIETKNKKLVESQKQIEDHNKKLEESKGEIEAKLKKIREQQAEIDRLKTQYEASEKSGEERSNKPSTGDFKK